MSIDSEVSPCGALEDLLVLDLASELTAFCTKVLADLGAEVVRIEPPQGERLRYRAPYYHSVPHPEGSLHHLHFNANKRGITLDITHRQGADLLRRLIETADVLVEAYAPGYLASLGLGYGHLQAINPRLIVVSITPFGQESPYSQYLATDIIGEAMGGQMVINGFLVDPPVVAGAEQAYHMTGLVAAAGTMLAVTARDASPERGGAHVDISMQECVAMTTLQTANANYYAWYGAIPRRRELAPHMVNFHRCQDGWVSFFIQPVNWGSFTAWLQELGIETEVRGEVWADAYYRVANPQPVAKAVADLCSRFTQQELYHEGQRRGMLCMPINSIADVVADLQLNAWGAFVDVDYPELGECLRDVAPPFHATETPPRLRRPAPRLGEDNEAIYRERLGLSASELDALRAEGTI